MLQRDEDDSSSYPLHDEEDDENMTPFPDSEEEEKEEEEEEEEEEERGAGGHTYPEEGKAADESTFDVVLDAAGLSLDDLNGPAYPNESPLTHGHSAVEQELWRIFTFYALHNDALLPEVMRIANFVRFARDCQMVSPKLTSTMIELEIVRLARTRKVEELGGQRGVTVEGNHTIALDFSDFLALLDALAGKVYPMPPGAEEVSIRRLLLENVLLLASRRERLSFLSPSGQDPTIDTAAIAVLSTLYAKPLQAIFKFYVGQADKRRSQEISAEALKKGLTVSERGVAGSHSARQAQKTREYLEAQRGLVGYPEYMQFCTDFSLRSTALLTAIQVGELYLNTVPLDLDTRTLKGMTFDLFCTVLVSMAILAYRNCHVTVTPQNKVKALLNFMWRSVNCSEKVDRLAIQERVIASSTHAGSLNMFGAGPFSDFFLAQWTTEKFPDYTAPIVAPKVEGNAVLKQIVKDGGLLRRTNAASSSSSSSSSNSNTNTNTAASLGTSRGQAETKTEGDDEAAGASEQDELNASSHDGKLSASAFDATATTNNANANAKSKLPRVLHDFQLAALFRLRPELSELAYLEIRNMEAQRRRYDKG